ncbi:SPT3 Dosage dependent suppressor of Ty-induced promoter mutations-like protein [Dissophora ornata]|nr:SPT3 Dosage dependent suppressor of Ty-induced promoter mutations-like protein [Dissophora ornata]
MPPYFAATSAVPHMVMGEIEPSKSGFMQHPEKELQEYVPTRSEDRLRIETIVYAELSIVKQSDSSLVKIYDYVRLPKELFQAQPDKVMSPEVMASKRILNVNASVQCPSNNWKEEREACVRCARRMSAKLDENESRIMHIVPELYRAENGDALINFRSGVANIQFKINCYCSHKKEKEGFVIRFDSQADPLIASHVTSPLMFYHQNKNRMASRALAAEAKAEAKAEKLRQKEVAAKARNTSTVQTQEQLQYQQPQPTATIISHMTPDSGPTRGGTLVTVHGSGFTVGEMMYICFGDVFVPVIPHHSQMLECFTPAWTKAETVAIFAVHSAAPTNLPAQSTFTYVDDNEKELIKLTLQRIMRVSARMDGPLESVMNRANELLMWNDILGGSGGLDGASASSSSAFGPDARFSSLETMILESLKLLDSPVAKNSEGLSVITKTGHTMLHLAVVLQYESLATDLIDRGIDITVRDKNRNTALDLARFLQDKAMMSILESEGMGAKEVANQAHLEENNRSLRDVAPMPSMNNEKSSQAQSPDTKAKLDTTLVSQHNDLRMDFKWEIQRAQDNPPFSEDVDLGKHASMYESIDHQHELHRHGKATVSAIPLQPEQRDLQKYRRMDSIGATTSDLSLTEGIIGQDHDRLILKAQEDIYNEIQSVNVRPTAFLEGGQAVAVRRHSDSNGGSDDAAKQAVVQSSRNDVDSEPVVFLGGLPVMRRVARESSSNPRGEKETTGPSSPSKDNGKTTNV